MVELASLEVANGYKFELLDLVHCRELSVF